MSQTYRPNPSGIRDLARPGGPLSPAMVEGARQVRAAAGRIDPGGDWTINPATVAGGWANHARAGASVTETDAGRGARRRVLARAASEARPS